MYSVRSVAAGLVVGSITCTFAAEVITSGFGSQWVYPSAPVAARDAPLGGIMGIAVDDRRNVIIADPDNRMILRLADGNVSILGGTGQELNSGFNTPAVRASFASPHSVAFDSTTGAVYIGDSIWAGVRKISADGIATGVYTPGMYPRDIAVDSAGAVYAVDKFGKRIVRVSADGTVTPVIDKLTDPWALAIDSKNNFYVSDGHTVIRVTPAGVSQVIAGTGKAGAGSNNVPANTTPLTDPRGIAIQEDASGVTVYIAEAGNHRIRRVTPDGIGITLTGTGTPGFVDEVERFRAALDAPFDVAYDGAGNLLIADTNNGRLRRLNLATNRIETIAGNGAFGHIDGSVADAAFYRPGSFANDRAGNIYLADTRNHIIRKISVSGVVSTIAGTGRRGHADGSASRAMFDSPGPITVTPDGSAVYVADAGNRRIRKIENGLVSTVAGNGNSGSPLNTTDPLKQQFYVLAGIAVYDGEVFFSDAWSDRVWVVRKDGKLSVYAGDRTAAAREGEGIPAIQAVVDGPEGLAVDAAGNLYIAEAGRYRVRRVDRQSQQIITVAGNGVRGTAGDGGLAIQAQMVRPQQVTVGPDGIIYVVDYLMIRKIQNNRIYTVAGSITGSSVPGGIAANTALLRQPNGILVDANGDLLILETSSHRIRRVLARPPALKVSSSAVRMTATSSGSRVTATVDVNAVSDTGRVVMGMPFLATSDEPGSWLKLTRTATALPAALTIEVDPIDLPAGVYERTITFVTENAEPREQRIPLQVTVAPAPSGPILHLPETQVSFALTSGEGITATKQLTIGNAGYGRLTFSVQVEPLLCGRNWLHVSGRQMESLPGRPAELTIRVNSAGLPAGTCEAAITVTAADGAAVRVPVYMNVSSGLQKLTLSQSGLTFAAVRNGGVTPSRTFSILNAGGGAMDWAITREDIVVREAGAPSWLRVVPASGTVTNSTSASVEVGIANYNELTPGEHFGQITVTSQADKSRAQVLTVVLNVLEDGPAVAPAVLPAELLVTATQGLNEGEQRLQICNPGTSDLPFDIGTDSPVEAIGILALPSQGTVPRASCRSISIETNTEKASTGVYTGAIQIGLGNRGVRSVPLQILIRESESGTKSAIAGASTCETVGALTSPAQNTDVIIGQPVTIQARVSTTCAAVKSVGLSVKAAGTTVFMNQIGSAWEFQGTWIPQPNLPPRVTIELEALAGSGEQRKRYFDVNVRPQLKAPVIPAAGGVRDSASLVFDGPVAPGGFVTIFGYELGDADNDDKVHTRVLLGGKPLRITSAEVRREAGKAPYHQINALLPFDLTTSTEHQLIVEPPDRLSVPASMLVASARPAVFTTSQRGTGQGEVLFNGTLAARGNAAPRGEMVTILCSGLGSRTVSPDAVAVDIGGVTAQATAVAFDEDLGHYSVTVRVPAETQPGDEVPVVIRAGGSGSQSGVYMAVR